MNIVTSIALVLEVIASVLLICVILVQKSKGGGLGGSAFGGGAGESLFGARAGNVLTKITIILSIVFMANTLFLAFRFSDGQDASIMDSAPVSREILTIPPTAVPGPDVLPADPGFAPDLASPLAEIPSGAVPVSDPISEPPESSPPDLDDIPSS